MGRIACYGLHAQPNESAWPVMEIYKLTDSMQSPNFHIQHHKCLMKIVLTFSVGIQNQF